MPDDGSVLGHARLLSGRSRWPSDFIENVISFALEVDFRGTHVEAGLSGYHV
jgi:hypothetical protein